MMRGVSARWGKKKESRPGEEGSLSTSLEIPRKKTKGKSIDDFKMSEENGKDSFRWSFGTHNSNQADMHTDQEGVSGEAQEPTAKKRGKRPKAQKGSSRPQLAAADSDDSDNDSSGHLVGSNQPAHLEDNGHDAAPVGWSRNPSQIKEKVKKKKKSSDDKAISGDPDPTTTGSSQNPHPSKAKVKKKKKKNNDDKSTGNGSIGFASPTPGDGQKKRKGKKKKRGKSIDSGTDDSPPIPDSTLVWSRVSAADPIQNMEKVIDYIDEDEVSLKASNSRKSLENTKSTRTMDSASNHSRDVSVKSSSGRKRRRKMKSDKSEDNGSSHSRSEHSLKSSSSPKKTKSSRNVTCDYSGYDAPLQSSNHSRKQSTKTKSTRSMASISNHSLDRSTMSSNHRRKQPKRTESTHSVDSINNHSLCKSIKSSASHNPPKKIKSTRSMDSVSNHSLDKLSKKKQSCKDKSIDSSSGTLGDAPKPKKKKKQSGMSKSAPSSERSFEWSRVPASKPMRKKDESQKPRDQFDEDEASLNSGNRLKTTELRKAPGRTFSGDSVDSLINRSGNELTRIQSKLGEIKSSRNLHTSKHNRKEPMQRKEESGKTDDHCDEEIFLSNSKPPKTTLKPPSDSKDNVDSLINRSGSELTRIQTKLERIKSSRTDSTASRHTSPSRKNVLTTRASSDVTSSSHSRDNFTSLSPRRPKTVHHPKSANAFDYTSDHSESSESEMTATSHDPSLDESSSDSQDDQGQLRSRQIDEGSARSFHDSDSSAEISYVEVASTKQKDIPKSQHRDSTRIDFAGQIFAEDPEPEPRKLRADATDDKRDKPTTVLGKAYAVSKLRKDLRPELSGEQEKLQGLLEHLEKFETEVLEEQNVLELEKQNLQSRVFEQAKIQEQLETTLFDFQETYQKLQLQLDDADHPVDSIHTRREALQTENEVLRLRIKRQEDTLGKYQKPRLMKSKSRESFRMSEVLLVSPAVSSLTQSAPQIRGELLELKAKLEERDKILEEQTLRRNEVKAAFEKVQQDVMGGDEISMLQTRIADLEKEKKDFMAEIARLQEEGRDVQEQKPTRSFHGSLSLDEEEDKADMVDMQSILEEDKKEESTVLGEQTQDVGFIGWLFGGQS